MAWFRAWHISSSGISTKSVSLTSSLTHSLVHSHMFMLPLKNVAHKCLEAQGVNIYHRQHDLFSIGPSETNFSQILIEIQSPLSMKMHLKMLFLKSQPFLTGLSVNFPRAITFDIDQHTCELDCLFCIRHVGCLTCKWTFSEVINRLDGHCHTVYLIKILHPSYRLSVMS